ncbi:FecR family protein [Gaoshiqia sp. Z1-71]|uniref:FecR family protein n=1 Tax=Gaoshiqia hydrogeniformans TaxID=3290090 RepID=UPI003BF79EAA
MKIPIKNYLEGKASRDEMLGLISWLDNHENQSEYKRIKGEWKANPDAQDIPPHTLQELDKFKLKLLNERALEIDRLKFVRHFYKYAAIVLLAITLGGLYFYGKPVHQLHTYNTIVAENGQISKALLPDQSVVWLNSGSSITYNNQFGINNRDIQLTGQAYFDVTKNRNLPLVVSCGEINVKVLGTRFTAATYPDEREIRVILVEGSVELTGKDSKNVFASLRPNEMMVYDKKDNNFKISQVVAEKYTSWRDGIIHIYDQPLKDAVAKLQKRYNQQIVLEEGLEDYKVTFSIKNEDFGDVLEMLLAIAQAKAYQEGEVIYLRKK